MKSLSKRINDKLLQENELTGDEFMEYWDIVGEFIENIKYPELKKYFPGMPRYTGDAKKLIMAGVAHVGAWVRGAASSAADDDPEGYDYDGEFIEDVITSRDPGEWQMIIDDMWNNDDYEKIAKKMTSDGDSEGADIVRWFEGEFCPMFFANWFEALRKKVGSIGESVTKDLNKLLTESNKDLPRANVLCPAETMSGEVHIIVGEPFTSKDRATHKKSLKLAMSLDPRASQFTNLDNFADIYRNEYGFDLEPSDTLVFVFVPSSKEVYTNLIDELTIL